MTINHLKLPEKKNTATLEQILSYIKRNPKPFLKQMEQEELSARTRKKISALWVPNIKQ